MMSGAVIANDRIEPRDSPSLIFSVKLTPSRKKTIQLQMNMIGATCERTDSRLSEVQRPLSLINGTVKAAEIAPTIKNCASFPTRP